MTRVISWSEPLSTGCRGPYSMLTIRYVVKAIRYDKSVSIRAIRNALKRVTIRS